MHALVVDDSRVTRLLLKLLLNDLGFEVAEAGNGLQGLEQPERLSRADLVLVDGHMPDMDGLAFVRAVRARASHRALPLLMITGDEETSRLTTALEAGANELVRKPF